MIRQPTQAELRALLRSVGRPLVLPATMILAGAALLFVSSLVGGFLFRWWTA